MVIAGYSNNLGSSMAKIHRHTYKFVRANPPCSSQASKSLLTGHIARGDPVNLSIEPDLLCLSRGFVVDLTPTHVTVGVTYKIDVDALLARTRHQSRDMAGDSVVFRIDKDEMASGMARMRNNIAQLFFAGGDENRRRLIVHLDAPRFETAHAPRENEYPGHLNGDQRNAMAQCVTAKDYALVLGMPGTGKTTTVAEIIKTLVARGKSVLLTSYTHSAVDTILMKLVNEDFGILRLGNVDKVGFSCRFEVNLRCARFTPMSNTLRSKPRISRRRCRSLKRACWAPKSLPLLAYQLISQFLWLFMGQADVDQPSLFSPTF
jgi:DNA replication ATP-dependent helicase Dna2